jgi:RNA polymerase sigma-70 factor, ECF subfamily
MVFETIASANSATSARRHIVGSVETPEPHASLWPRGPSLDEQAARAIPVEESALAASSSDASPRAEEQARDLEIVARVQAGELAAFNRLVDLYQDYLFGVAYRILADRDHAADAVQDALLHAYRHLGSFRGGSFRSWLTRIGVNACMDLLRARRRRPSQPFPELEDDSWEPRAPDEEEPEARAARAARARVLTRALQQITPDQRAAIVLFDVEGYDYEEISSLTGVSLGTVKSRIHRGRLALRALLEGDMELFR